MEILVRHATDDFSALMTAQAMENCGADVFSVTVDTSVPEFLKYIIWCKLPEIDKTPHKLDQIKKADQIKKIDEQIEKLLCGESDET